MNSEFGVRNSEILTRIQIFVGNGTGETVVEPLVRESQIFIGCMVASIDL